MKFFLLYVMMMGNGQGQMVESQPFVMEAAVAACEDRMEDMKDHVQQVADMYRTHVGYKYLCLNEDEYNVLMEGSNE